jgi:hypothetical protein
MEENDLSRLLTRAADELPVTHRNLAPLQRRAALRRGRTLAAALVGGVAVMTGLAILIPTMLVSSTHRPNPPAASTASAGYVGGRWRLTSVADGTSSTSIPGGVGANLEFRADGQLLANDGTNSLSARFSPTAGGFEVRDVGTTLALYGGDDPHRLAAIAGLNTVLYGNAQGVTGSGPVSDRVVRATDSQLVIEAGTLQLTFAR